jgi:type II restriction enzyme
MNSIIENRKLINKLEKMEYFSPTATVYKQKFNNLLSEGLSNKEANLQILNQLTSILVESQNGVEDIINNKINNGRIKDDKQARKAIAGSNFQSLVAYALAQNVICGNIDQGVVVNVRTSNHELIKKYAAIKVGDENSQKPDSDVLLYKNDSSSPIINFSCKTSLRERAGQTYRWKLLVDLATCNCEHIACNPNCPANKYNLQYEKSRKIYICFVTSDLYNEINNPQISGMFTFFDFAFITKTEKELEHCEGTNQIAQFDKVVEFINQVYNT